MFWNKAGVFLPQNDIQMKTEDTMFTYESILLDASSSIKGKLGSKDIAILDAEINKRAENGWELVTYSHSVAGYAQFLLTFKKQK